MSAIDKIQTAQIANLYSLINNLPPPPYPTSSNLEDVLLNGNSAGASNIDMNTNNIDNVNTINGELGAGALTIVGDGGISMTSNQTGITLTALVDDITLDSSAGNGVFLTSNNDTQITSNNGQITINSPNGNTDITAGLDGSFTAGDNIYLTATTNDINLNAPSGSGIFNAPNGISLTTNNVFVSNGTNDIIVIAPNILTHIPKITLTDGTLANEMTNSGFTTTFSIANATNYLAFVSDDVDGSILPIRKTTGISCNPSTNVITCGINLPTTISAVSTSGSPNVVVTLNATSNTFREFSYSIPSGSSITGINISSSRMNGRYRIYLTAQGVGGTLNKILSTTAGFNMYTSYVGNQSILAFTTYIVDIQVITPPGNPTAFCVSLTKFD